LAFRRASRSAEKPSVSGAAVGISLAIAVAARSTAAVIKNSAIFRFVIKPPVFGVNAASRRVLFLETGMPDEIRVYFGLSGAM
jgi:hypothetical protein